MKEKRFHLLSLSLASLLFLLLVSCSGLRSRLTGQDLPSAPFVPPTLSVQSSPTPLATPTPTEVVPTPEPTATVVCSDELTYLEDMTIPDGTIVEAGVVLEKIWLVENAGSCNWDDRYRLRLSSGPEMGASPEQALFPARSGAQARIRLVFTAPEEPGTYQSVWQAYSPEGEPFGDVVYLEVVVE